MLQKCVRAPSSGLILNPASSKVGQNNTSACCTVSFVSYTQRTLSYGSGFIASAGRREGVFTTAGVGTNSSVPSPDTPTAQPAATALLHKPINAASTRMLTLYTATGTRHGINPAAHEKWKLLKVQRVCISHLRRLGALDGARRMTEDRRMLTIDVLNTRRRKNTHTGGLTACNCALI